MVDLISGGRLEMGLGSGAYQREFDRMAPGVSQKDGHQYMQEALPLVRKLWQGDVAHNGAKWQFPKATSCPKPVQKNVPMWVAARSPATFDYAVANDCNVMSWPLTMGMEEAEKYAGLLADAKAKAPGWDGTFAMMRHTGVYDNAEDRAATIAATRNVLGQFGNLMMQQGEVHNGFPEAVPLAALDGNVRVDPAMLEENLMFGTPESVVAKLKKYQAIGVDAFIYYASMGLDMDAQKRSMQLFINEVMPEFT